MATRFVPKPGATKLLAMAIEMQADMKRRAQSIAQAAQAAAPIDEGDYREAIVAEAGIEGETAIGRVNAYDYKSWFIEAGTEDTPTFAPLRRGAEAAGYRLEASDGA